MGSDAAVVETAKEGDAGTARPKVTAASLGLRWWREAVYCVLVYVAYSAVRNSFGSGDGGLLAAGTALDHAKAIIHIEKDLHLYFEPHVQDWYLGLPAHGFIRFWNVWYGLGHFVVAFTALILMFRRQPERYRLWRNTLAFTTILALVGFASFSLMPPRLLDDPGVYGGCQAYTNTPRSKLPDEAGQKPCDKYGFVDTVAKYGGWASFGSEEMAKVSNQYAAMPSMHIGWSTWCALVLVPLVRRKWVKALAIAYPILTLTDIVLTANHYWIDGLGGLLCLGVGFGLSLAGTNWWMARRRPQAANPVPAA